MRALNGVLLLDKPPGCTSNGVLQQVRKLYGAKKAGHTGSLDPSATGMLPVCFGEATKLSGYMLDAEKTYQVTGLLGVTTDTEDSDGEELTQREVPELSKQQMLDLVATFHGEQMQRPPMYSAIKKQGVRAYKLARRGETVELDSRPINVKSIELTEFSGQEFSLVLRVSKGTYIRSIVRDIGEQIGCGAHVTNLRRLSVSPFDDQVMHSLEAIQAAIASERNADELLLATDEVIADWRRITVDDETAQRYQHGSKPDYAPDPAQNESIPAEELFRVYNSNNQFLGLGRLNNGKLETVRLIHGQANDDSLSAGGMAEVSARASASDSRSRTTSANGSI